MTLPDDLFEPTTPPSGAGATPRCRHPRDRRLTVNVGDAIDVEIRYKCGRCNQWLDPARQRRGRNARKRGLAIQRQAMRDAGMDNLPGNIPGLDGSRGMFRGESKSAPAGLVPRKPAIRQFPENMWAILRAIPAAPGQIPLLVVSDTPGPGRKRRQLVVLELSDWKGLHGE